jgi:hypothetical protein
VPKPISPKVQGRPSKARRGDIEGFIALASTVILFLMPSSPPLTEAFSTAAFVTLVGLDFLLGLEAIRFGGMWGRATGGLALLVLSLVFLSVLLVLGIMKLGQVRSYWGA